MAKKNGRRAGVVAFLGMFAMLGFASAALACVGEPRFYGLSSEAGAKGAQVVMSGGQVKPNTLVEIRWNGLEGAKLAETTSDAAGNFSLSVIVPDVAADVYSLVAVSDGKVARSAFQVTGAETGTAAGRSAWAADTAPSSSSPVSGISPALVGTSVALVLAGAALVAAARKFQMPAAVA